jgi:hypothetical protein
VNRENRGDLLTLLRSEWVAHEKRKEMQLKSPTSTPVTEYSKQFLQGMVDRMSMSFHKYGRVAEAYPGKVDAIESLKRRLDKYKATGNTEWLMDVANFAMIEFMHPRHPEAHFEPTDSNASPGRKWHGELDHSARGNQEL